MEQEKSVMKLSGNMLPGFVEKAYESIEEMQKFADLLLKSKLCPVHFYEKGPDGKVDYNKGKPEAVIMVLLHGGQLGMSAMQSLQQVVPVNGLMSVKGNGAKALIFNSGKLKAGSWKEERSGSVENEDLQVSITATRNDNGETMTRSFSIDKAKRAGLWITAQMLASSEGWKHKLSSWYKYPDRMPYHRALGNLANDLFPDVMSGTYTTEEAQDMPADQTTTIITDNGATILIPDKQFVQDRSSKLSSKAVDEIDKRNLKAEVKDKIKIGPNIPNGAPIPSDINIGAPGPSVNTVTYKENDLMTFMVPALIEIIKIDSAMIHAMNTLPGRNTNKKLREIILAWQAGTLKDLLNPPTSPEPEPNQNPDEQRGNEHEGQGDSDPPPDEQDDNEMNLEGMEDNSDITPAEGFEPAPNEIVAANPNDVKLPFNVPASETGSRDFKEVSYLFGTLNELDPPIDDKRFKVVAAAHESLLAYKDKEDFCRKASENEFINLFLWNKEL